jgi:hypothetical protein
MVPLSTFYPQLRLFETRTSGEGFVNNSEAVEKKTPDVPIGGKSLDEINNSDGITRTSHFFSGIQNC